MEVHYGSCIFIKRRLDILANDVKGQYIFYLQQAILRKKKKQLGLTEFDLLLTWILFLVPN